jgi:hypothetical protein
MGQNQRNTATPRAGKAPQIVDGSLAGAIPVSLSAFARPSGRGFARGFTGPTH